MDDSCQDRQDNERAALKAIYGDQLLEITNENKNEWTPLECILTLCPQGIIGHQPNIPSVDLHIVCPEDYPNVLPFIYLENWKKISNEKIYQLDRELASLSEQLQGEVMIFELSQYIEKYLHTYDQPEFESFYEEMVKRQEHQREKELKELKIKKAEEDKKREEMRLEIQVKEQAVKKALRRRQNSVQSLEGEVESATIEERIETFYGRSDEKTISYDSGKIEGPVKEEYKPWKVSEKGQSRFENEFEHIKWLGKGAFGDVIKVRNKLDDGLYAIKRIELNPSEKQLNKKITREVKLLSRLNHENVVRYYNSWIESSDCNSSKEKTENSMIKAKNINNLALEMLPHHEPSFDWNVDESNSNSEESSDEDWVMFQSTSNENFKMDGNGDLIEQSIDTSGKTTLQYMYIQMELCDKSTLRIAIDDNLYSDSNRVWRLFREIVEGLCHIHLQGIIHRDLKPVNIFIGYDDHVKIGDFGLATTIVLQKQSVRETNNMADLNEKNELTTSSHQNDFSHTGQVGTTLYIAPELNSSMLKFSYNEKVDIFSLGIIFFEMCHAPITTTMERFQMLSELRKPSPVFPPDFPYDEKSPQQKLIRCMLQHDVDQRPTSQELLQCQYIPPPKLEEAEVKEMVRRTLMNPQSRDYKYLIASCFNQAVQTSLDATYNISSWRSASFTLALEVAANKLRNIFQNHGAASFLPPLLTPANHLMENAVCFMTRLGSIVHATHDLQSPFARYLAHNPNIVQLKRYAIDKVYRERPAGVHPKEIYECAFDIVTPTLEELLPEYELLSVIWAILTEFSSVLRRNCIINLNHSYLVSAMLKHCGLDESKHRNICASIFQKKTFYHTKSELECYLKSLGISERISSMLIQWMEIEGPLNKVSSVIYSLIKNDETRSVSHAGFKQLELILNFCDIIGITCPVLISLGHLKNAHYYSGLMVQVICSQKNRPKETERTILLSGGRYDNLLQLLKESLPRDDGKCNQYVIGFTMSVDKLIFCLEGEDKLSHIDAMVCVIGKITMSHDKLSLLRDLWKHGIKTSFVQSIQTLEEIQCHCRNAGIPVIILIKETEAGFARIRTLTKDRFYEKKVPISDVVEYIHKAKSQTLDNVGCVKTEVKSHSPTEGPLITFVTPEKLNQGAKRRYESQILNNLSAVFMKFSTKVKIEIFATPFDSELLKAVANIVDSKTKCEIDLSSLIKKYPRHKKCIHKLIDHVEDSRQSVHTWINIIYSLQDGIYKVLL
ncbi:unnamed protein product [Nezara viridula]|uniref:non-specific serine/threonine protein kinase n=2 Tax=Nezara viridula TaxID=85310 RepID=A0A9P0ECG1_NEZVI|nr:unnamed protein product [Nezara viridula]